MQVKNGLYDDLFKAKGNDQNLTKFKEKYNFDYGCIKELQSFIRRNKSKTLQEFKTEFNNVFKDFDFYFKIGFIKKLMDKNNTVNKKNILIRQNELIHLDGLPEKIRCHLKEKIEQERSIRERVVKIEIDDSQYWILHTQKISSSIKFATEYAHEELAKSLGILNLLSGKYIFSLYNEVHPCYIVMNDSKLEPSYSIVELEEIFPLTNNMIEILDKIENIFKKNKKNDIDKRIIKALDIYSQIHKSTEPVTKIVIYMTILENLLLDKKDKEGLTWKLADRVAFLIGNKIPIVDEVIYPDFKKDFKEMGTNNKYVINALVKKLYDLRSSLVHSSDTEIEIEMFDTFLLIGHNIILNVIIEFLDLDQEKFTELKDLIKCLECIKYDNTVVFKDQLLKEKESCE